MVDAISKEKLAEETADTTEDLKQEEPFESSAIEGVAEDVGIPSASDSQEQFTSSQAEEVGNADRRRTRKISRLMMLLHKSKLNLKKISRKRNFSSR